MVSALPSEPGTLEHELHECLARLVDTGKLTTEQKKAVIDEYDELEEDEEWSMEFRMKLQKLFALDADILEARVKILQGNTTAIEKEIAKEEGELDGTIDEEWDIVEGVARKQAEVYAWAKGVFDPLGERLAELERQKDLGAHAVLLEQMLNEDDKNRPPGETDWRMAA